MPDRRFSLIGHTHLDAAEVNDLTAAVTWANIPSANVLQAAVTQHVAAIDHDALLNFASNEHFTMAAISITQSQISDLTHPAVDLDGITPTDLLDKSATETISGAYSFTDIATFTKATSGATNTIILDSTLPGLWFLENDQSTDEGGYKLFVNSADFSFFSTNDAGAASVQIFKVIRGTGTAITRLEIDPPTTFASNITGGRIRLTTTTDASLSSTNHAFQIGSTGSANIIMDGNELIARTNGSANTLNINITGGTVAFGTSGANRINLASGQITSNGFAFLHYITTGYTSGKITVATTAPSSPAKGDVWFDTS